ncbi:MAG: hypothetical protein ACFNPV_10855 [Corynebacterium matruchotii]
MKRVDLPEGDTSIPMSRGAYVVTLKDGSVHKVIVKPASKSFDLLDQEFH